MAGERKCVSLLAAEIRISLLVTHAEEFMSFLIVRKRTGCNLFVVSFVLNVYIYIGHGCGIGVVLISRPFTVDFVNACNRLVIESED